MATKNPLVVVHDSSETMFRSIADIVKKVSPSSRIEAITDMDELILKVTRGINVAFLGTVDDYAFPTNITIGSLRRASHLSQIDTGIYVIADPECYNFARKAAFVGGADGCYRRDDYKGLYPNIEGVLRKHLL
jgi:hypothetical protein